MQTYEEATVKRRATRSKTGCLTCRKRKRKCDEIHPICKGCTAEGFACDWPSASRNTVSRVKSPNAGKSSEILQGGPPSRKHRPLEFGYEGGSARDRSSVAHSYQPVTIRAAITDRRWKCANSMTLTPQDRRLLEYFPSTGVYRWHNIGRSSTIQYLVQNLAPSSSVVTRMMIALSASEMQRKGLPIGLSSQYLGVDLGLHHYNLALGRLRNSFAMELESERGSESLAAMLAAICFMVHYENQSLLSPKCAKVHVGGLWTLLNSHPIFRRQPGDNDGALPGVPFQAMDSTLSLSCRIVVLLLSADITLTMPGVSASLLRLLYSSGSPCLKPARLFQIARSCKAGLWGDEYPPSGRLADMALHRPLELAQEALEIRFRIWNIRASGEEVFDEKNTTVWLLLDQILQIGKKYADVLLLADEISTLPWSINVECITRHSMYYWSCILFHRRMLGKPGPQDELHRSSVSNIVWLLQYRYQHEREKFRHGHCSWPIFMAAIETPDPGQRSWLLEKLDELQEFMVESQWLYSTAEKISKAQIEPGVPWVDLAEYIQP